MTNIFCFLRNLLKYLDYHVTMGSIVENSENCLSQMILISSYDKVILYLEDHFYHGSLFLNETFTTNLYFTFLRDK